MAGKHEQIQEQLLIDWSVSKRGRLYNCRQGLATPYGSEVPIWFGPLKRTFHGFPDTFGFEFQEWEGELKGMVGYHMIPIYGVIDVKTIAAPYLSKDQKNYMGYIRSIGGFAYVAMESKKEGELYFLKEFEG